MNTAGRPQGGCRAGPPLGPHRPGRHDRRNRRHWRRRLTATGSEMPKALAAGNPANPVIARGGLGVAILALYVTIVLPAGTAIHLFPGHPGKNSGASQQRETPARPG